MRSSKSSSTRDPMRMVCSSCGRTFLLDETPTPPFCSEKCQLIDLGRWLDEEIGVPHEGGHGESPTYAANARSEDEDDDQNDGSDEASAN